MTFYQWQLVGLVAACVVFLTIERYVLRKTNIEDHTAENSAPLPIVSRLAGRYLSVYAIVMGERHASMKRLADTP